MGANLQLLGFQAIQRLAERFDVELDGFVGWLDLFGTAPEKFPMAYEEWGKILEYLFEEFGISWWDVYLNSDIGMERMAVSRDIALEKDDMVLDVGCGRGYFTIAAAKCSGTVISLDIMNGAGRYGWWANLRDSLSELKPSP